VRDAVLAAQEHAAHVHVLDPLPGLDGRVQHAHVLGRVDAGVVDQHVHAAELLLRAPVHAGHLLLVGHVGADVQVAGVALVQVDAHHGGPVLTEHARHLGTDAGSGAGDNADLPFEPAAHVAKYTFLTSV
jgi:hypothetical protein